MAGCGSALGGGEVLGGLWSCSSRGDHCQGTGHGAPAWHMGPRGTPCPTSRTTLPLAASQPCLVPCGTSDP